MPDALITLLIGLLCVALSGLLFLPGRGLVSRWQRLRRISIRVLNEDALKHILQAELKGHYPTLQSIAGALHISVNRAAELLAGMEERELVTLVGDEWHLTAAGRNTGLHVIRSHRLWERHLADETGFAQVEWHQQAERYEHELSPEEANALAARLGQPAYDPHGDPIPTAAGELISRGDRPLTSLGLNELARIVHIEDEPEIVYAQLVAEGLYPGVCLRLTEVTPQRVRFWVNGDEHVLAPIVAANVSVMPISQEVPPVASAGDHLDALKPGEKGRVLYISPRCRGSERRRMLDLGILPGTLVEAEMVSAGGDPTAYRVRGAVIALRREQAGLIRINRLQEATE